jgi:tetratricopeptide (TPR) repeat protein
MKNVWRSLGPGAALIVLLTVVVYLPALRGGFIWDDGTLITENRMIRASDGLHRFWFTTEAPDYYPLTSSLWWLEWRLWGNKPMGYHVVNVVLHALNAVLVWVVLQRLKIPGAWLAGLVFAVHPVNVATVAWISEQKNTLSMLFYLVAIFLYLRFDEEGRWYWYGLSLMTFLLALLSKTAVVMLPVVLLACVWWRRGRLRWKDVLSSVPFFALSAVSGLATIWFQHHRALEGLDVRTEGFSARLATAGWAPWFYLCKALLPLNLTVIYPKWEFDGIPWFSYLPGLALGGCLAWFWRKRDTWGRPLLFGIGYFVLMLFPVLGFFDQGFYRYSLAADHWQYYSIAGVIGLAVAIGVRICSRTDDLGQRLGAIVGAIVVLLLALAAWQRSLVYATDETLWRDNVQRNPAAWTYNNLGNSLLLAGKHNEAIPYFQQSLQLDPSLAVVHYNLAVALKKAGRSEEEVVQYNQALRLKPDYAMAHYNLGIALWEAGDLQAAQQHWEEALRIQPDLAEAHNNLAAAMRRLGRLSDEIWHYEQAVQIEPSYAMAHSNLGDALLRAGRVQEAIYQCEHALRIRPDFAEAHFNLAAALEREGRNQEAIEHYERAAQLKPRYAEAYNNLGALVWRMGKTQEAIHFFEQALQIKPDYAEAHYNLGGALEQAGKLTDAMTHYEQALRTRPDLKEARDGLARLRGIN